MTLHRLECLTAMKEMPENSVDSIVSDPPYELGFMGKSWDNAGIAYSVEMWSEALRILKPGGHLLAFGGTRTYHRMACAIEDASFEIRDSIHWIYGSGFPKSLNVGKAIDKAAGVERTEIVGTRSRNVKPFDDRNGWNANSTTGEYEYKAPVTPEAQKWQGWGTALKPAHEPIVVARKPLIGTVAANVLEYGTGALNIDGCRIGTEQITINTFDNGAKPFGDAVGEPYTSQQSAGRWPANIIFDEDAGVELDAQSGTRGASGKASGPTLTGGNTSNSRGRFNGTDKSPSFYGDSGGASRFFYCAKASKSERNAGLEGLPEVDKGSNFNNNGARPHTRDDYKYEGKTRNTHPTVKPLALMRYLVRLVTPPGGVVFDPFLGSGTTAVAAILEGFEWAGCEMTEDYWPIIEARVEWAKEQPLEIKEPTLFEMP